MVHKLSKEVMDTLNEAKSINDDRRNKLEDLKVTNEILRQLGSANVDGERLASQAKMDIERTDKVLRKFIQ